MNKQTTTNETVLSQFILYRELLTLTEQEITYMIHNHYEKICKEEERILIKPFKYNHSPDYNNINKLKRLVKRYNNKYYDAFCNSIEYIERHCLSNKRLPSKEERKELLEILETELCDAIINKVESPQEIFLYLLEPLKRDRFDLNEFKELLLWLEKKYKNKGNIRTIIEFLDKHWDALYNEGDCYFD